MIKCKDAIDYGSDCGSDICCFCCPDKDDCNLICYDVEQNKSECPDKCPNMVRTPDELKVMEEAVPDKIQEITDLMIRVKEAEERISKIKGELLKAMVDKGIKKFENDRVSFTYVAPTTRKTLDKKKLEKEHPEINLADYDKLSKVSASVRIQVK